MNSFVRQKPAGEAKKQGLRVLAWPLWNGNAYLDILYTELQARGVTILSHREHVLKGALARVDAFHFHWLNSILNRSAPVSVFLCAGFFAYLMALKARRTKIIWTVHNLYPFTHKRCNPRLEIFVAKALFYLSDALILHNKKSVSLLPEWAKKKVFFIPHHNYAPVVLPFEQYVPENQRPYLLLFGGMRRNKEINKLVTAFSRACAKSAVSFDLFILGRFDDQEHKTEVLQEAGSLLNSRIFVRDEFISSDVLSCFVKRSAFCLCVLNRMTNSGSLIYALSHGSHVVSENNEAIKDFLAQHCSAKSMVSVFDSLGDWRSFRDLDGMYRTGSRDDVSEIKSYLDGTAIENLIGIYIDILGQRNLQ